MQNPFLRVQNHFSWSILFEMMQNHICIVFICLYSGRRRLFPASKRPKTLKTLNNHKKAVTTGSKPVLGGPESFFLVPKTRIPWSAFKAVSAVSCRLFQPCQLCTVRSCCGWTLVLRVVFEYCHRFWAVSCQTAAFLKVDGVQEPCDLSFPCRLRGVSRLVDGLCWP